MLKENKSEKIVVRVTKREKDQLEQEAHQKDITVSECARRKIIKSNQNMKKINKDTMKDVKQISCNLSTELNKLDNGIDIENSKNNIIKGAREICVLLNK